METIKKILENKNGLLIEDYTTGKRKVEDKRFELFSEYINTQNQKDNKYYEELVKVLSNYLSLYDSEITFTDYPITAVDENGKTQFECYDTLQSSDINALSNVNRSLAKNVFEEICTILRENKDIKLDAETLTKLLDRKPKVFPYSVEKSYLTRPFNFKKLIDIITTNQILQNSNISIEEIYQILIDTCQIDNEDVFSGLVTKDQFKDNHKKITEFLGICNANVFVDITKIIIKNFDKDFNRLDIIKKRNEENFYERTIIQLLKSNLDDDDTIFIHQLLTDETISIDYDYDYADYFGQTTLRNMLAFSKNKILINDLLSKKENIRKTYWHGERKIQLYSLYAIIGDYENALATFQQSYNYANDFTEDFENGFKDGHARGDFAYTDSLVEFINDIGTSFNNEDIEYETKVNVISSIINNDNVNYINLDDTLPVFKKILTEEDFNLLLDSLITRYNNETLGFITVSEGDGIFCRYNIDIASEDEIKKTLATFNNQKVLKLKSDKRDD